MHEVQFVVVGPDRYCPDCGRILLKVNDGSVDLSAKTEMSVEGTAQWVDAPPDVIEGFPTVVCMRRRCRLRRFVRRESSPVVRPPEVLAIRRQRRMATAVWATILLAMVVEVALAATLVRSWFS